MNKQLSEVIIKNPYPGENDGPDSITLSTLIDALTSRIREVKKGSRIEYAVTSNNRCAGYQTTLLIASDSYWYTWETAIYKVQTKDGRDRFIYTKIGKGNMQGVEKPSVRHWYIKGFDSAEEILGCALFSELYPKHDDRENPGNAVPDSRPTYN